MIYFSGRSGFPSKGVVLNSHWQSAHIADVLKFCAIIASGKAIRTNYPAAARRRNKILDLWFEMLIELVAPLIDLYIIEIYPLVHDVNASPPVIRYTRAGVRARAAPLDPDTGWTIISRAAESNLKNLKLILEAKNDEHSYDGLATSLSSIWQKAELLMYWQLNKPVLTNKKQIVCMADCSCHCGDETLVGNFWVSCAPACMGGRFELAGGCPPTLRVGPAGFKSAPAGAGRGLSGGPRHYI